MIAIELKQYLENTIKYMKSQNSIEHIFFNVNYYDTAYNLTTKEIYFNEVIHTLEVISITNQDKKLIDSNIDTPQKFLIDIFLHIIKTLTPIQTHIIYVIKVEQIIYKNLYTNFKMEYCLLSI